MLYPDNTDFTKILDKFLTYSSNLSKINLVRQMQRKKRTRE